MIMIEMITPLETAMQPYLNPFVVWGSARFLVGFCHMHFWVSEKLSVVPGGSSWCCRARRHFAEAVEFRAVQRHHGGADAPGRRRSRIRRSRHRGCLQGSRQVNAVPLPCRESKCFGVKKNKTKATHDIQNVLDDEGGNRLWMRSTKSFYKQYLPFFFLFWATWSTKCPDEE